MIGSNRICALALLSLSWIAAVHAHAATLVVGPGGAPLVTHTSLQGAVDAAADDDTIVILPGAYPGAFVPHKRLIIVGSGAASTTIGSLRMPQPFGGAIDTLTIRDVRIMASVEAIPFGGNVAYPSIEVSGGNALVVEDCILDASTANGALPVPAAILHGALRTSFSRCVLRGGNGHSSIAPTTPPIASDGAPALTLIADSQGNAGRLVLTACDLFGGTGFDHTGWPEPGGSGGDGMLLIQGEATAVGSKFGGADAGPGSGNGGFGGDGTGEPGAGVRVQTGATLIHQASVFTSGMDVFPGTSPSPAPILLDGGAAVAIAGTPALLATSGKTPVGSTATIAVSGAPGAGAALLVGAPFPFVDASPVFGPLGLTPAVIIVLPNLPASGTFSFGAAVPALPSGLSSASIGLQAYVAPTGAAPLALSNLSIFTAVIPGL